MTAVRFYELVQSADGWWRIWRPDHSLLYELEPRDKKFAKEILTNLNEGLA